jgi:spermidine synthase
MEARRSWFLAGLSLTTFSTLALEIVDTRLLSVSTWYHLSFFVVSTAMFGMAAGGLRVYLGGEAFAGRNAPRALADHATLLALTIPILHVACLTIPIPTGVGTPTVVALSITALALGVPFYLSGIVVAIALTRIPGPSGLVYAVDLLGAALGSLAVLALFEFSRIASAIFAIGAVAAVAAACLHRFAATGRTPRQLALALGLLALAVLNDSTDVGLRTLYAKGRYQDPAKIDYEHWTIHGQVSLGRSTTGVPFLWSKAAAPGLPSVALRSIRIDGAAATMMTQWDGSPRSLRWMRESLTALPFHLRKGGKVAVVGVGGGRDILAALWAESDSVTGIEINEAFIELLEGPLRDYAGIANDPRVTLVHDEARSYLTRTRDRYDVVQISLTDTWAATGTGAFTLSENGLYTVEAWKTFLGRLRPGGLIGVSRWYSPTSVSETSRLVSLATAALLESGASDPRQHMILTARSSVATLILSDLPLREQDLAALDRVRERLGLQILLAPGRPSPVPFLERIAAARTLDEVHAAAADPRYDYLPPTDERPYFFNILKPGWFLFEEATQASVGVIATGNMLATLTLAILWVVTFVLVLVVILAPLARSGLPRMDGRSFSLAVLYFGLVGLGFMLVQIPLMQRFSVYLGHPTYSLAVTLFSMILAAGAGSLLSDRIPVESTPIWLRVIPLGVAANLLLCTLSVQPLIDRTIELGLLGRCSVTAGVVGVAAFPLGLCFPIGLRLVRRISDDAMPWMWGVNGAAGVLASVSAIWMSIWSGISTSLYVAACAYALLALPAVLLWRRGAASTDPLDRRADATA